MAQNPTTSRAAILRTESWENEGGSIPPAELAEKLGVVRHVTETYSVGEFRYTNLADAIAQARRMSKLGPGTDLTSRSTLRRDYFGFLLPLAAIATLIWVLAG